MNLSVKKNILVILIMLAFSAQTFASWVGLFMYSNPVIDHIHIVVMNEAFTEGKMLNTWSSSEKVNGDFRQELQQKPKFVIFHHEKTLTEIQQEWQVFFRELVNKRTLLGKNCAYATSHVMRNILNIDIDQKAVFARLAAFIYVPNQASLIPLPDSVRRRSQKTLKALNVPYYTHHTKEMRKTTVQEQMAFLQNKSKLIALNSTTSAHNE